MRLTGTRSRRLALAALLLLLAGCSGEIPTRPQRDLSPRLTISLTLSSDTGDPAHPVTAHARVVNVGFRSVTYFVDCVGLTPEVLIHSPDGTNINHPCGECPNAICPACAGFMRALEPGESVETIVPFDGRLMHCDGSYEGPSGVYGVDASLSAQTSTGQQVTATDHASFTWTAPAPR